MTKSAVALAFLLAAAACGKDTAGTAPAGPASPKSYALATEPSGATPVAAAIVGAPKDDVSVVGRIKDFTKGYLGFTLVDAALSYCGEHEAEGCPEPWDYCCVTDELPKNMVFVVVKDAKGMPVAGGKPPELRNLDLVVVRGRLVKDKSGNVEVEATGWYRKERPTLPEKTVFPQ